MREGGRNVSQVRIENGIIMFYGNKAGRVEDGCAVVDPMFKGEEISRFLERQRHIREVRWMGCLTASWQGDRRVLRRRDLKMSASGS